jgi:hypothetical protein
MWVIGVQSFTPAITEKFIHPILSSLEMALDREDSSTIQLEALTVWELVQPE